MNHTLSKDYLEFNERTDVLASLNACLICLRNLSDEPSFWKWAILSLHNALQGAMVCHLSGTANIGALSVKSVTAYLVWHERDNLGQINKIDAGVDEQLGIPITRLASNEDNPPKEFLANAEILFKRLSNGNKRCEGGAGAVIAITNSQRKSFRLLNELRKQFTHFAPIGWSIELAGLPNIFLNMVEVIEAISHDDWPFRHMNKMEKGRMDNLLEQLKAELRAQKRGHAEKAEKGSLRQKRGQAEKGSGRKGVNRKGVTTEKGSSEKGSSEKGSGLDMTVLPLAFDDLADC